MSDTISYIIERSSGKIIGHIGQHQVGDTTKWFARSQATGETLENIDTLYEAKAELVTLHEQLEEKWGNPTRVAASERGKYQGQTKAQLLKRYHKLKKSGPHQRGSKEHGTMRELAFAIRAKSGWGKVESVHSNTTAIVEKKKKRSPYAIGMAAAMKQTGDKPPLKKSTITRAHDIARAVMRDSVETPESSVTEELESTLATLKKLSGIQ